jgi:hypothetical protein
MTGISLKAHRGDAYLSLAELLFVLGRPLLKLHWKARISEASGPEEVTARLTSVAEEEWLGLFELLHLVTPDVRIAHGEVTGYDANGERILTVRAVDSSWWDIETEDPDLLETLSEVYPDAMKLSTM